MKRVADRGLAHENPAPADQPCTKVPQALCAGTGGPAKWTAHGADRCAGEFIIDVGPAFVVKGGRTTRAGGRQGGLFVRKGRPPFRADERRGLRIGTGTLEALTRVTPACGGGDRPADAERGRAGWRANEGNPPISRQKGRRTGRACHCVRAMPLPPRFTRLTAYYTWGQDRGSNCLLRFARIRANRFVGGELFLGGELGSPPLPRPLLFTRRAHPSADRTQRARRVMGGPSAYQWSTRATTARSHIKHRRDRRGSDDSFPHTRIAETDVPPNPMDPPTTAHHPRPRVYGAGRVCFLPTWCSKHAVTIIK